MPDDIARELDPLIVDLREARLARELRQCDVAEAAGFKQGNLCKLELGRAEPMLSTLRRWAAALGYDLKLVPRSPDAQP